MDEACLLLNRFLRYKLSPMFGTAHDVFVTGETPMGEDITPASMAKQLVIPLAMRDIYDSMIDQGVPAGTAISLLAIFGMGVQVYQDDNYGSGRGKRSGRSGRKGRK